MSAAHPAWWFSENTLGGRGLLRLAGEHAAPGAMLGMSAPVLKTARKDLEQWGLPELAAESLSGRLDEIAEATLARFVAEDRRREAAELAQQRKVNLEAFRAKRQAAYEATKAARRTVRALVKQLGPAPSDRGRINGWVSSTKALLLAEQLTPEALAAVGVELGQMIDQLGYNEPEREKIVGFLTAAA